MQSLTSRALGADLHPAAKFGKGVFIAHPLGAPLARHCTCIAAAAFFNGLFKLHSSCHRLLKSQQGIQQLSYCRALTRGISCRHCGGRGCQGG